MSKLRSRTPVYLLTGFLGSGKTTLLKTWLSQPEFLNSALIINEIGEVGLDHYLLGSASESAALLSSSCVCCTGLPGLEQTLEDLFWSRLNRQIPKFDSVVIETTGLAHPDPIIHMLATIPLLQERYELAGTIVCVSATTAAEVLAFQAEAWTQLLSADIVVLTKTDLMEERAITLVTAQTAARLATAGVNAIIEHSALGSLSAQAMLEALSIRHKTASTSAVKTGECGSGERPKELQPSGHQTRVFWRPFLQTITHKELHTRIAELQASLGQSLVRLKGYVLTESGAEVVQISPFCSEAETIEPPQNESVPASGLNIITAHQLTPDQEASVLRFLL